MISLMPLVTALKFTKPDLVRFAMILTHVILQSLRAHSVGQERSDRSRAVFILDIKEGKLVHVAPFLHVDTEGL